MLRFLCFLFLFSYPVLSQQIDWNTQIKNRPFSTGTAAPASSSCDASAELNTYYLQTGNPASVVSQVWVCSQTGASSYAWQPVSHKIGTTAPATCTLGQVFFDSDATAGENWYGCTATDTWTQLGGTGGGSGASSVSELTDCTATRTSTTNLSVGACTVTVGLKRFTVAADTTCALTATVADTAYAYLLDGTFIIGFSDAGSSIACSGWTSDTGISAFPADSVPLFTFSAITTPGEWDTSGGTDYRSIAGGDRIHCGTGLTCTDSGVTGKTEVAINSSATSQFATGTTASLPASCTVGQYYFATDENQVWGCVETNTWSPTGWDKGTAAPAACSVGMAFFDTDASAGSNWMLCTATDTWTAVAGGSGLGDPGSNGIVKRTSLNTTTAATDGTDYVSPSGTATLTNKTLDVEGTGNAVTTIHHASGQFIRGNASTQTWLVDYGATGPTVGVSYDAGADITYSSGVSTYCTDADGPCWFSYNHPMPSTWDPAKSVDLTWVWWSSSTTGTVAFQVAIVCRADGEDYSLVYNTASIVTATNAVANKTRIATATGLDTTGCAAGEVLTWRILRDRTHASDTFSGAVGFKGPWLLTWRETQ